MKRAFLVILFVFYATSSFALETKEFVEIHAKRQQASIKRAEDMLADLQEPRSQLQAMKKRELETYLAKEKQKLAELTRTLEKGIPEDIIIANRKLAEKDSSSREKNNPKALEVQKKSTWQWADIVSTVNGIFDEGYKALVHSGCLAIKLNNSILTANTSSFYERSSIAFCQKGIEMGMSPVKGIDCQTCAGTFTLGSTHYQSGDKGKILRATTTTDDGMVFDITKSRVRASWPQSGFYIVYSIDTSNEVKVVEVQSYITENLVRSYASPKEQENYNVNTLFRKIDQLFQQSDLSVFEFSRRIFQAEWLENGLKALRNET